MMTEYVTKPGDRWDVISYKAYGSVNKIGDIIRANPSIPANDILQEGLLLQVPILDDADVQLDATKLPPWKQ